MKNLFIAFLCLTSSTYGQISDPVDLCSKNFKLRPETSVILSDSIAETSGLIAFDGLLWTLNDDRDKTIYGLDSLGKIKKKIMLNQASNHDWEEISQDNTHLYIGDFGNNTTGNRTDLHILKIDKKSFLEGNPMVETISFSYSDQTDFSSKKQNTTNFDCEAFIVSQDSIYLFTKQWATSKTSIYSLPNQSGNHIAKLKTTLKVKGLVTGATFLEAQKLVVLCGYSKKVKPYLYLLYGFENNAFLSGNKRKIKLRLPFYQIEGITTRDGLHYYATNEALIRKPILNIPQQIHQLDLSPILGWYLDK